MNLARSMTGGFTFPEDPGVDCIRAAPMWRADADPRVLSVLANATTASDAVDVRRFDPHIFPGLGGEHVRVTVHGEVFRLDVVSGSVMSGPVCLTYLLARDQRMAVQMNCIQRLQRGLEGTSCGPVRRQSRISRSVMALRAHDARADGASLREMATELLAPGEWPGPGECRKSAMRRLVAMGEKLVRQGPLPVLQW
jgi:hypothetical protein